MIVLNQVSAVITVRKIPRNVLSSVTLKLPSNRRIALFGSSNENKKILISLLGGVTLPTSGHIVRRAKVSFPVGYVGSFLQKQSVRKNVEHLARLYGADVKTIVEFVQRVSEVGPFFDKPFEQLDPLRRRLIAKVVGYSIPFDVYVVGDEMALGRTREGDIPYRLFLARSREAGMIVPTNSDRFALDHCERAMILEDGQLFYFNRVEKALSALKQSGRLRPDGASVS